MSENEVNDRKKKGDDDWVMETKKGDQGDHGTENEGDVESSKVDDVDNGTSILKNNLDFFFKDGECSVNMHNYSLETRRSPSGTSGFVAVCYTVIILDVYTCM